MQLSTDPNEIEGRAACSDELTVVVLAAVEGQNKAAFAIFPSELLIHQSCIEGKLKDSESKFCWEAKQWRDSELLISLRLCEILNIAHLFWSEGPPLLYVLVVVVAQRTKRKAAGSWRRTFTNMMFSDSDSADSTTCGWTDRSRCIKSSGHLARVKASSIHRHMAFLRLRIKDTGPEWDCLLY